jgi:hypothetical protein
MYAHDNPVRLVVLGWCLVVLMAVLAMVHSNDQLANLAAFGAVALGLALWVALRPGRAALITSLVLGALHTVEQTAYVWADMGEAHVSVWAVSVDLLGLAGGVAVVTGAIASLRRRRRAAAQAAPAGRIRSNA